MENLPTETNCVDEVSSFENQNLEELCLNIEHLKGQYDCAIVILCGGITEACADTWKSNWISRMRVIAGAMEYYNAIEEERKPMVIVSGGTGGLEMTGGLTVSKIMKDELIELEVPSDNILLEQFSLDTSQNAQNTSKILRTLGFDEQVSIKLVTNGFHLKRSENLFKKNFKGNLKPKAAEEIMMKFGKGKLPGQKFNRRYGEFAERYYKSCKNKRRIIQDSIIRGVSEFPGGQELLTKVAKIQRSGKPAV
jgi:hypothetical protein